jgi:hypothetical protein
MNNQSGLEFKDISTEESRTYVFPGGDKVTINEPLQLHVAASGSARVLDAAGVSHYVPSGFIHLYWKVKEGAPNFVL